jgi:hypothetical protein
MEHYILTTQQREYLHDLLVKTTKRPLNVDRNAWLMDLQMMFDSTNDKTIIVKGDV